MIGNRLPWSTGVEFGTNPFATYRMLSLIDRCVKALDRIEPGAGQHLARMSLGAPARGFINSYLDESIPNGDIEPTLGAMAEALEAKADKVQR